MLADGFPSSPTSVAQHPWSGSAPYRREAPIEQITSQSRLAPAGAKVDAGDVHAYQPLMAPRSLRPVGAKSAAQGLPWVTVAPMTERGRCLAFFFLASAFLRAVLHGFHRYFAESDIYCSLLSLVAPERDRGLAVR